VRRRGSGELCDCTYRVTSHEERVDLVGHVRGVHRHRRKRRCESKRRGAVRLGACVCVRLQVKICLCPLLRNCFEACQTVFPSLLCAGPCTEPQREPTAFDCAITQATVERSLASPRSKLLRLAFGGRGNEGGECGAVKNVVQICAKRDASKRHSNHPTLGQTEWWAWVTASRSDHMQHSRSSGLRVVPTCTRCSQAKDSQ
jgi:hypothetical protein